MTQFLEYVKMALMNIKSNKGRSILTMLGIIIGISSVIMVLSIGNGVSSSVTDGLNSIAGGQLYFSAYSDTENNTTDVSVEFTQDVYDELMEKIDHVMGVSPVDGWYGTVKTPKGQFETNLYTGMPAMVHYRQEPIVKGHFFTQADYDNGNSVCVISETSAITMFGTTDVIGNTIEMNLYGRSGEMTIIGIRKDSDSSAMMSVLMGGDIIEMDAPMTAIESLFGFYSDTSTSFYVFTEGPQYATQAAAEIMQFLRNKYRLPAGSDSIQMEDFNTSMDQISQVISYITVFVVFVAAISLLVGGIGVMNIMLVSVTERTREIGIRKALGARTSSIMLQFLSESAIITMLGGIIGIILGQAGAGLVCNLMGLTPKISAGMIALTTLFSSGVGLFFGIYPAKKAAKLSPIEALRHE